MVWIMACCAFDASPLSQIIHNCANAVNKDWWNVLLVGINRENVMHVLERFRYT